MIWLKLRLLALMLALLPTCSTVREVPVPVFPAACDPGPEPQFPELTWVACGKMVCLDPEAGSDLYLFKQEYKRYLERVRVCKDTRNWQKSEGGPSDDVPSGVKALAERVDVGSLVADMSTRGMSVTWAWGACGEINAFYAYNFKFLVMCYETLTLGVPAARAIAAHEMGHALIRQNGVKVDHEEDAADEIGALWSILEGNDRGLLSLANFLLSQDGDDSVHSPRRVRAQRLVTWVRGAQDYRDGINSDKAREWKALRKKWEGLRGS